MEDEDNSNYKDDYTVGENEHYKDKNYFIKTESREEEEEDEDKDESNYNVKEQAKESEDDRNKMKNNNMSRGERRIKKKGAR